MNLLYKLKLHDLNLGMPVIMQNLERTPRISLDMADQI